MLAMVMVMTPPFTGPKLGAVKGWGVGEGQLVPQVSSREKRPCSLHLLQDISITKVILKRVVGVLTCLQGRKYNQRNLFWLL